jgi:hypothetical protein
MTVRRQSVTPWYSGIRHRARLPMADPFGRTAGSGPTGLGGSPETQIPSGDRSPEVASSSCVRGSCCLHGSFDLTGHSSFPCPLPSPRSSVTGSIRSTGAVDGRGHRAHRPGGAATSLRQTALSQSACARSGTAVEVRVAATDARPRHRPCSQARRRVRLDRVRPGSTPCCRPGPAARDPGLARSPRRSRPGTGAGRARRPALRRPTPDPERTRASALSGRGRRRTVVRYLRPPYRTARAVFPQAALNGCSPSGGSSHACWESVAEGSPDHTHRRGGSPAGYAIRRCAIV